jgi:hypothetical protein
VTTNNEESEMAETNDQWADYQWGLAQRLDPGTGDDNQAPLCWKCARRIDSMRRAADGAIDPQPMAECKLHPGYGRDWSDKTDCDDFEDVGSLGDYA